MERYIIKTVHSITFFLFIFCFLTNVNAQNIAIEQDGACINCPDLTADPSAALEVRATDRGILIPRLANTSAVANPVAGLIIYDNSVYAFQYYNGTTWKKISNIEHISFSSQSTYVGVGAGVTNTSSSSTAIGYTALYYNYGYQNTAVGASAMFSNTSGIRNTATGASALSSNTTGNGNTAVGFEAMGANSTGYENTAYGREALKNNETGHNNTAVGFLTLGNNETGFENTACGNFALWNNTTGGFNTAQGYQALYDNETGFLNTAIGYTAFFDGANYNNSTAIGYLAQPTGSNQVRLGNNAITQIGGYANWSNISDARFKTQIQPDVPGLAFISLLQPVTYQMDMDAIAKHHQTPDSLRIADSERAKAAIRYTGFLAQDVEKAAELIGYDFSGVDTPQHERDNYSLRYAEFVVPLVKAVQELEEKNEKLESANTKKDQKIADLEIRLSKIETMLKRLE